MKKMLLIPFLLILPGSLAEAGPIRNFLQGGTPVRDFIKGHPVKSFLNGGTPVRDFFGKGSVTACAEALPENFTPPQSIPQKMSSSWSLDSNVASFQWSMDPQPVTVWRTAPVCNGPNCPFN